MNGKRLNKRMQRKSGGKPVSVRVHVSPLVIIGGLVGIWAVWKLNKASNEITSGVVSWWDALWAPSVSASVTPTQGTLSSEADYLKAGYAAIDANGIVRITPAGAQYIKAHGGTVNASDIYTGKNYYNATTTTNGG